jgi:dephospho-CoA kinase
VFLANPEQMAAGMLKPAWYQMPAYWMQKRKFKEQSFLLDPAKEFVLNKKVNRAKLGEIVFSDHHAKKKLEDYLHPKIRKEIEKQSIKQDSFKFPYLIDIPLFFENGNYDIKESVVVYTPKDIQLERFIKRNGYTKEESLKRINSQMPIDEKKSKATWVIDNSKDLKHLQQEVEDFVAKIKEQYL